MEESLSVEQLPDGRYKALWPAKADELKQMGTYLLTADSKGAKPVKKAVPAFKSANNSITVDDFAIGYNMTDDANGVTPVANAALRRYPYTGSYTHFRAFVKITQAIKGVNGTSWYSDALIPNATLDNFEWISEYRSGRMPRNVKKLARAWSGGNSNSLNLSVTWRQFSDEVIKQRRPGIDRWYGFRAQTAASSWGYRWQVGLGVTWWGARFGYNKRGQRQVWQLPTDRKGQTAGASLSYPYAQERQASFYDKPNFPLDPYFNGTHLWWPDPSGNDKAKWKGRIVGQGVIHTPIFDSADTNAPAGQGEFNAKIMHYAMGFINTPYGWGGQTYGGQQSRNGTDFTRGEGSSHIDTNGLSLGDSRLKSSYGIDCSGFVSEVAHLAGVTGIPGQGYTAGGLMTQGLSVDNFDYLRQGDFVAWSAHTFYVWERPTGTGANIRVRTLEAQPDVVGTELGRTRFATRTKSFLVQQGAKWRRWRVP